MSLNACPGRPAVLKSLPSLGSRASTHNPTKSNRNSTAQTLPKNCHQTSKPRSKGSQHKPQNHPEPSKLTSRLGLEGRQIKNMKISNPCSTCHVLTTSRFSQTRPFSSILSVQNWPWSLSPERVSKTTCKSCPLCIKTMRRNAPEGPGWSPR